MTFPGKHGTIPVNWGIGGSGYPFSAWHCEPRPCTRAHVLPSACHRAPRPCTRRRVSVFCMSLRASAHTGVAIRVPAGKRCKLVILRANSYALSRIRPKHCFLSCPAAGDADCHVASLLAMTCKNLLRVRTARTHYRGKFPPVCAFTQQRPFAHAEAPPSFAFHRANPPCNR